MNKAALFGGALFSAGLAVGAVNQSAEADFTFTDGLINYGVAYSFSYYGGTSNHTSYAYGPAFFGYMSDYHYNLSITAHANPTSMGFTHYARTSWWPYSYTCVLAYFQVSEDTNVRLDWSFGPQEFGQIGIADLSGGGADFFQAGGAGSAHVSLTAGDEYLFAAMSGGEVDDFNFGTMVIPTPAALPLLAAGGLLVSRRRRRE